LSIKNLQFNPVENKGAVQVAAMIIGKETHL